MKIKLVGKAHRQGTSKKTGNPYDFYTLYYNAPGRGVDGMESRSLNMDPHIIPYNDLKVGSDYDVDCDPTGYVLAVTPVKF